MFSRCWFFASSDDDLSRSQIRADGQADRVNGKHCSHLWEIGKYDPWDNFLDGSWILFAFFCSAVCENIHEERSREVSQSQLLICIRHPSQAFHVSRMWQPFRRKVDVCCKSPVILYLNAIVCLKMKQRGCCNAGGTGRWSSAGEELQRSWSGREHLYC